LSAPRSANQPPPRLRPGRQASEAVVPLVERCARIRSVERSVLDRQRRLQKNLILEVGRSASSVGRWLVTGLLQVIPCTADASCDDAASFVCGACAWQFLLSAFS